MMRFPKPREAVAAEFGTKVIANLDELAGHVSAVTIAVADRASSEGRRAVFEARRCVPDRKNRWPGIRAEGKQIVELGKRHNALLQVGHIERFNPAVVALAKLNLLPRFHRRRSRQPLPFRSLDVGVVLDVMIHDIDIVLSLVKSPVTRVDAVGASVIGGVEDVCNARLTFENGCVANLTASRLALKTERKLRFFSHDAVGLH